jgi:hypothetical protein
MSWENASTHSSSKARRLRSKISPAGIGSNHLCKSPVLSTITWLNSSSAYPTHSGFQEDAPRCAISLIKVRHFRANCMLIDSKPPGFIRSVRCLPSESTSVPPTNPSAPDTALADRSARLLAATRPPRLPGGSGRFMRTPCVAALRFPRTFVRPRPAWPSFRSRSASAERSRPRTSDRVPHRSKRVR